MNNFIKLHLDWLDVQENQETGILLAEQKASMAAKVCRLRRL